MSTDYVVAETHTASLSGAERSDFWREHVRLNQGRLDFAFEHDDDFEGSTLVQRLGEHQIIEFWSDPVAYVRRSSHARADDDRSLRLLVPRSGSVTVERNDEVVTVEPGWAALMSMTSAFTVRHDELARAWILNVPEHEWCHRLPVERTATLDLRLGAGAVTRGMVHALSEQRGVLSAEEFTTISSRVSELLNLCAGRTTETRLTRIEQSARALVRRECDDPALTPARLAERLGWSLRQVQSALAEAGTTPSALIKAARLSRARARLTSPSDAALGIGEIAHRSGFGSLSGFNAAFREEYGASPRAVRAAAAVPDAGSVAGERETGTWTPASGSVA